MQLFCQWLMVGHLVLTFFGTVYTDINGRKAKEPQGFAGFVATVIIVCLFALIFYGAGSFDQIRIAD